MPAGLNRFADLRHAAFLTLAAVAVALKVLVPPGFMLAADTGRDLPIVLCTAYGAKVVHVSPDQAPVPADDDRGGHDAPCAFAGHAAAPTPPTAAPFTHPRPVTEPLRVAAPLATAPGRGLAAPPPPSQAPPRQI